MAIKMDFAQINIDTIHKLFTKVLDMKHMHADSNSVIFNGIENLLFNYAYCSFTEQLCIPDYYYYKISSVGE